MFMSRVAMSTIWQVPEVLLTNTLADLSTQPLNSSIASLDNIFRQDAVDAASWNDRMAYLLLVDVPIRLVP